MRVYIDSEFMEDGTVIIPVALAAVTETGEAFYGVFGDSDRSLANDFVQKYVLPYVDTIPPDVEARCVSLFECYGTKTQVANAFLSWIWSFGGVPEFWAYQGAYDWIMIAQMYGDMSKLPQGWPRYCNELQQKRKGRWIPKADVPHHCLSDAIAVWDADVHLDHLDRLDH